MVCNGVFCKLYHSLMISLFDHEPSGELGSYSERISAYDIIYRTLQGKPFSVNYPFYPTDCFWFLISNSQCQNLLFFLCLYLDSLGYLHNRIKLLWQVLCGAVLLFIPYLWISKIQFWISKMYFWISKIDHNTFLDIQKSVDYWISIIRFLDIQKWIMDILKYTPIFGYP